MACRKIPVFQSGGGQQPLPTDLKSGETYRQLLQRVASQCHVNEQQVEVWTQPGTQAGHRVIQKKLDNVADPIIDVIVVVKEQINKATELRLQSEEHVVTPSPISLLQPTEGLSPVVCFAELFDNGIRAQARKLELSLARCKKGNPVALTYSDDGTGMAKEVARNYLRMGYSNSGVVDASRVCGMPLAVASYFSKNMSRHGKGALALLYFGHKIQTLTKVSGNRDMWEIQFDLDKQIEKYNRSQDPDFKAVVTPVVDITEDDDAAVECRSFTETQISALQPCVAEQLVEADRVAHWAQELAGVYYFFTHGMPQQLWDTLPPELRPTLPAASGAAASSPAGRGSRAATSTADCGRPAGGLTLTLLGHKIGRTLSPDVHEPPISVMLNTFLELRQQFQADQQPDLVPFWLPVRWCEEGMHPNDQPCRAKPNPAYTIGVADEDGTAGVAGQLQGCFRDFLVLLLYFPMKEGERTKPKLYTQGTELCLFPIWSGRLIPEASCLTEMPAFVGEAAGSGQSSAFKLIKERLGGVAFFSPEVYTTNNKTNFKDPAYKVFMELGSSKPHSVDSSTSRGRLFVWNSDQHHDGPRSGGSRPGGRWVDGSRATGLLLQHYMRYWAPLESDGQLLDGVLQGSERIGKQYKLPGRDEPLLAGQLVRFRSEQQAQAADIAAAQGGATGGVEGGKAPGGRKRATQTGARGSSFSGTNAWPSHTSGLQFAVVVHFVDQGADSGRSHFVRLRRWRPDWVKADVWGAGELKELTAISCIYPLAPTNAEVENEMNALQRQWVAAAPHHLAWYNLSTNKAVARVEDMQSFQGTDMNVFGPSQLPEQLSVCFATKSNEVASLEANRWGEEMQRQQQAIQWSIESKDFETGQFHALAAGSMNYQEKRKAQMKEVPQWCKLPGSYRVTFTAAHASWINDPLVWEFKVQDEKASSVHVSFGASSAAVPQVRLGCVLPDVFITLKDSTGKKTAMPFTADGEAKAACKQLQLMSREASDNGEFSLRLAARNTTTVWLDDHRTSIGLKNYRILPTSLGMDGHGKERTRLHAQVFLQLQLPGVSVPLEPEHLPDLVVLSGPVAQLRPDNDSPSPSARGSRVQLPTALLMDDSDNPFDVGAERLTAIMRFDPPSAVALHHKQTGQRAAQGHAAAANAAGAGSSHQASKRRKGSAAAAAGGGGGTETSSHLVGQLCTIDGNVIELPGDFRWCAAPASKVVVTVQLYSGVPESITRSTKPLLEPLEMEVMMRHMHLALEHPLIKQDCQARELATHRRYVREGKAQADRLSNEVFELNTADGLERCELRAGHLVFSDVPPAVVERLDMGYELRKDMLAGQQVNVFVTPDGRVLRPNQPMGPTRVPESLASHWNSLMSADRKLTFEVAFCLAPDTTQLADVVIKVCDDADRHDPDFWAQLQVLRLAATAEPVFPASVALEVGGGQLRLPTITLDSSWFKENAQGTATFAVMDVTQSGQQHREHSEGTSASAALAGYQLGRFHIRLLPAAANLSVMAAGDLFQGATVSVLSGSRPDLRQLKRQLVATAAGGAAGRSSQLGAWAPWETSKASSSSSRPGGGTMTEHIHPRLLTLDPKHPLKVQLGEVVVLHFIATDLQGLPACLTKEQAAMTEQLGLQLLPAALGGSGGSPGPSQQHECDLAGQDCLAEALAWSWASGHDDTISTTTTTSAGTASSSYAALPAGHLGGWCVNAVTLRVVAGCGACQLNIPLQSSCGPRQLTVPLRVEAGPVAVDGLCVKSITQQQPPQRLTDGQSQAVAAQGRLLSHLSEGLIDRRTWAAIVLGDGPDPEDVIDVDEDHALNEQPPHQVAPDNQNEGQGAQEAAAAAGVKIKPDPDVVVLEGGVQQPVQDRAVELAVLDRSAAALLHRLSVQQGCTLLLQLQLVDEGRHPISADRAGRQLQLVRHEGWQQPDGLQQLPAGTTVSQQQVPFKHGKASVMLNVGVGDSWLGQQLFELVPCTTPPQASDGDGSGGSSAGGDDLNKVLPVLLLLEVQPGPYPCRLELASDVVEELRLCIEVEARDGRPLAPQSLQPLRLQLLKWAPREVGVSAAAGYSVGPRQLASCWHEVQLGGEAALMLPAAQLHQASGPAGDGKLAEGAGPEGRVGYEVAQGAVTVPPVSGLYKLTASYPLPQQDEVLAALAVLPVPPAAPADVLPRLVVVKDLAAELFPQTQLLLLDQWGNPCSPAAADLLLGSAAAAGVDQLSMQGDEASADPGNVLLPQQGLADMGITQPGDYRLVAQAVPPSAAAAAGGTGTSLVGRSVPELLLAAYCVAAEDQAGLRQKQLKLKQAQVEQRTKVERLRGEVASAEAQVNATQLRLRSLTQERDALQAQLQQMSSTMEGLGTAQLLPDQPQQWLPDPQHPQQVPSAALLLPRAVTAAGRAGAPVLHAVQGLLPSQEVCRLIQQGGLLGPMICLGAVECEDVARLLTAYLSRATKLVAVSEDTAHALRRQRLSALTLTLPELVDRFAPDPSAPSGAWDQLLRSKPGCFYHGLRHLQRLNLISGRLQQLLSRLLTWDQYDPAAGFIGFADNLIRLTPDQLQVSVPVKARPGRDGLTYDRHAASMPLGLRQTLWHFKLSNTMVFETADNMHRFRQQYNAEHNMPLPRSLRLLALDGSTFNVAVGEIGHRLDLPHRPGDLLFSGVPSSQIMAAEQGGPLDLRLRQFWERHQQRSGCQQRLDAVQQDCSNHNSELKAQQQRLATLSKQQASAEAAAGRQLYSITEQLQELEQQLRAAGSH
eukprot:gene8028-8224_t